MTITATQQAQSSAVQLVQNGNQIIAMLKRIKVVLDNGVAPNPVADLPGFATSDLDAALGSTNLGVLTTLVNALPAS